MVTLTEVLPVPLKAENSALVQAYEAILLNSREFECVPVDRRTAITAARLRAQYEFKTPDALHVAAALEANCDAFLTNDKGILRVRNCACWCSKNSNLNRRELRHTSRAHL